MNIHRLIAILMLLPAFGARAQSAPTDKQRKDISVVIDKYSDARENRDTVLLKAVLQDNADQLVSTGEWRTGIRSSIEGMLKSSASSPGTRTLTIDKIRMLGASVAIVDCKYEIQNPDGGMRRMWSTFVLFEEKRVWKISAIRNMLPSQP